MPNYKRKLTGAYTNESKAKRAEFEQKMAQYKDIKFQAPDWLDDKAKIIFYEMLKATKQENFKQVDMPALATFAQTYENIQKASKHTDEEGMVVDGKVNPYQRVLTSQINQMEKLIKTLGFSPQSRAKIEMNAVQNHEANDGKNDPFLKVLDGKHA